MVRERRLCVVLTRLGTFVTAIAAMLIAVNPLGGTASAATNPTAQFRELICRMVDGAAAANRLPGAFLARILWQESHLRNEATSPAGAEGVAQFMPRTAAEHGLADPRDPGPAITAAARRLADLKIKFGNLGLAAAAYNAGPGRLTKWLYRQSDLPVETRRYVVAVTGRPIEDWTSPVGNLQMSGEGGEPCLAVMPDQARSAPTQTAIPGWLLQLDRDLARAVGVVAPPPARRDPGLESLRASLALCDRIRLLGARCAVYQP